MPAPNMNLKGNRKPTLFQVYEEEAAQRVQYLFDAIDSLLYEGTELPDEIQNLDSECQYWSQTFPHLR